MPTDADEQLVHLASPTARAVLSRAGLGWTRLDAHACAALRFVRQIDEPPLIAGLIGGASSGKSTVFNALLDREVSLISAHAHETLGPIIAVHGAHTARLRDWIASELLFCGHEPIDVADGEPTAGRVDAMYVFPHAREELTLVLLCDLPDVTSQSAADEGAVTRNLSPFFDALIVVVDEERWFDAAVFEDFLSQARAFGPRAFVVFNRTERDEPLAEADRAKLAGVAERHRAADYCVSTYQPGSGYRPVSVETCRTLLDWLGNCGRPDRRRHLASYLQQRSAVILAENVERAERFDRMRLAVDQELAHVARDASLTLDLLTHEERGLLGLGHRFVPLYDLARQVGRRIGTLAGRRGVDDVDFDKRPDALAGVLRRNLELRYARATARIDELVADSGYFSRDVAWENAWSPPELDADDWARRIRAHIEAWKQEAQAQSRKGDLAAVSIGTPLLVADLLFLGGAGLTTTWAAAWVAGFLGSKGLVRLAQRSPAYASYQTTVKTYQALLRESMAAQWAENVERMPRRHLQMSDPTLIALMELSTPGRA